MPCTHGSGFAGPRAGYSFLDHRGQRLLGVAARLKKARKVAASTQFRNAQLDRRGTGVSRAVAEAVALVDALGAALAMRRATQRLGLQLHQPLRGEADHLAQ
jgi:hypothetical protein